MRQFCRLDRNVLAGILVFSVACLVAVPAIHASIISTTNVNQVALPGAGVTPEATTTPPNVSGGIGTPIIFKEVSGVVGAGGLPVDHLVSGNVTVGPAETASVVNPLFVSGVIPAGTPFESYLFHFDPVNSGSPSAANFYTGSNILFSNQILGIQIFSNGFTSLQKPALTPYVGKLEAGDLEVFANGGPPASYYPGGLANRGLEEDQVTITAGGFGITLQGQAQLAEIDQIRILVAVPEPATLTMAFAGIMGIMGLGRSRSRAIRS